MNILFNNRIQNRISHPNNSPPANNSNTGNNGNINSNNIPPIFRQFPLKIPPPQIPSTPTFSSVKETPKNENIMTWGKPTWFLFHTLAEKVIDSKFIEIRSSLLDILYSICVNLPCPTCAEHAKAHLNGINFNTIRNKEDLKMLLFDFHNHVNSRKNFSIFKYEELEIYKTAITKNIVHNFLIEYNKKSKNIRFLADDLHRERVSSQLKNWFVTNLHFFEN
jgi:hypothetical protein